MTQSTPAPRRRALRRLVALLLSLAVVVLWSAPASSAVAPDVAPTVLLANANEPGEKSMASCLQSAQTVSVLFLLDRSGSLKDTDPAGVRYEGVELALRRLSNIKKNALGDVAIDAGIASFDDAYAGVASFGGWGRVNGSDSTEAIRKILEAARDGSTPRGATFYERALTGAEKDLADRKGSRSCRVLIWFTDGAMTDGPDAGARMCAGGGLMDRLRQEGIIVVGLRLQDGTNQIVQTAAMEAMAVGRDPATTCGTWPIPESSRPGVFLEAKDKAGLRRLFISVWDRADGCSSLPTPTVDPGMHRFRVVLDGPPTLTSVRFDGPAGASLVAATSGGTTAGGYTAQATSTDGLVTIDLTLPAGQGAGAWTVTPNVPLAATEMSYAECADLTLAIDPAIKPIAGGTSTVPVTLRAPGGGMADLAAYKSVVLSAVATGPDGTPRTTVVGPADAKGIPVAITLQQNDTQAVIAAKVAVTAASSVDIVVPPLTVRLATKMSDVWPIVDPAGLLRLPPVIRKETSSADITLSGSPKGPTKVCFDPPKDVLVPADQVGVAPQYHVGCVDLGVGESKKVTVTVVPAQAGQGSAQATIPVTLHSAALPGKPSESAALPLPVEWRFETPIVVGALVVALIVATLLALLPLVAVAVANKVSARYEVRGLQQAIIPVTFSQDGLVRSEPLTDPGLEGRIIDTSLLTAYPSRGKRTSPTVTVPPVKLRAHAPWNPFKGAQFWVELPPGHVGFSTAGERRSDRLPAHPGLGFLGVVAFDLARIPGEDATSAPGSLVVFRRDRQARGEKLDEMVRAALRPAAFDSLRKASTRAAGAQAGAAGMGGAGGPSGAPTVAGLPGATAPVLGRKKRK
jgi:hypothetical protein